MNSYGRDAGAWLSVGIVVTGVMVGCAAKAFDAGPPAAAEAPTPRERYLVAESPFELRSAQRDYVQDLMERYGEPGEREAHRNPFRSSHYLRRASRLFREWNPLGFSGDHVRMLLGEPHTESEEELYYFFDTGRAGTGWRLTVNPGGVVVGIQSVPGQ